MTSLLFVLVSVGRVVSALVVDVIVNTDRVLQQVNDTMFVGVALDTSLIQNNWGGLDFSNKKVLTLTRGLSPSYLRLGGVSGDTLTFDPGSNSSSLYRAKQTHQLFATNFTMSAQDWDDLNTFSSEVGMDLIFGLNALKRNGSQWDPSNAIELLHYTQQKGYKLAGIELGNEPDDFLGRFDAYIDPDQMGADALSLSLLLSNMSYYDQTNLIGPDTAKPFIYFDEYLDVDGGRAVDVASFHQLQLTKVSVEVFNQESQLLDIPNLRLEGFSGLIGPKTQNAFTSVYYFSPEIADLDMFTEPYYFDDCIKKVVDAVDMVTFHAKGKPVWLGETSTTSGAGSPDVSNTYVAGFMWLDKLGVSAKYGIKTVLRQDLYGSYNSLLQQHTFEPNPDYWLTFLYKHLVGSRVFNLTTSSDNSLRMYAHCAKQNSAFKYGPGSIVVYAINLNPANVTISMPQYTNKQMDVFWLTPQDNNLQAL